MVFWFLCLDDFARHVWPVDLPFTYLFLLTFTSLMSMLGDLDLSMFGIFRSLYIYIKKAPCFWNWHALEIINFQIAPRLPLGVDTYIFWGDLLKMHDNLNQPYLRYSFGTRNLTKKTGPENPGFGMIACTYFGVHHFRTESYMGKSGP